MSDKHRTKAHDVGQYEQGAKAPYTEVIDERRNT
jgi:hypothetical protein